MSRFPALTPANDNLDATQSIEYDLTFEITNKVYGNTIVTHDADGSLRGPFNMLLYTPTINKPWIALQLAIAGIMPKLEAEAAILGVLSVTKAAYGIYAHTILAEKAGHTAEEVKSMLAGICPTTVAERQAVIFNLAVKLAETSCPLDKKSFDDAASVLGLEGVAAAIQQIAAFMYASIMLNAGDVSVPTTVNARMEETDEDLH